MEKADRALIQQLVRLTRRQQIPWIEDKSAASFATRNRGLISVEMNTRRFYTNNQGKQIIVIERRITGRVRFEENEENFVENFSGRILWGDRFFSLYTRTNQNGGEERRIFSRESILPFSNILPLILPFTNPMERLLKEITDCVDN